MATHSSGDIIIIHTLEEGAFWECWSDFRLKQGESQLSLKDWF
jgi:hypothetical protein